MFFVNVARSKRQTWYHRAYLVLMWVLGVLWTTIVVVLWIAEWKSKTPEMEPFLAMVGTFFLPLVLLWLFYRSILFILHGKDAFE
jgi:hypothetical protein